MSRLRIKTTYTNEDIYGHRRKMWLYCEHDNVSDTIIFRNEEGQTLFAMFDGSDMIEAIVRLANPIGKDGNLADKIFPS